MAQQLRNWVTAWVLVASGSLAWADGKVPRAMSIVESIARS
jgi:hypothetical protein